MYRYIFLIRTLNGGKIRLNSKLMIIALFIISLLTVSAVNAEDNSTFDVASAENPNEKITIESNNNVVSDNSSILTVTPDNTNKNSYDENISTNKNNVILKKKQ